MVDQDHDAHGAYQTSGNIAVDDAAAIRFIDFAVGFHDMFDIDNAPTTALYKNAKAFFINKKDCGTDTPELRYVKGLIRCGDAKTTCHFMGIPENNDHFLEIPFYETGRIEKMPYVIMISTLLPIRMKYIKFAWMLFLPPKKKSTGKILYKTAGFGCTGVHGPNWKSTG